MGAGTAALGRGGAYAARADDPMALVYNPAALALQDDSQLMLNLNNAFYKSCLQRTAGPVSNREQGYEDPALLEYGLPGTYGQNVVQTQASTSFGDIQTFQFIEYPEVCQNNQLNPGAWLAYTFRPTKDLGLGFGLVTPSAAAHTIWGDGKGGTDNGQYPSPVRYMLIEQEVLGVTPTLGAAYRLLDNLSLGVSFQVSILKIDFTNITVVDGSENPAVDNLSELSLMDAFIPAVIGSLHYSPIDSIDLTVFGRWSDEITVDDGQVDVKAKIFGDMPLAATSANDAKVNIPQPGHVGLGARYASRRSGRKDGERGDPMRDEVWDIELDVAYLFTSQMDVISVDIPRLPDLAEDGVAFDIPHFWEDQWSIRLGGDYNVIAETLAVRAGAHYETSAINNDYISLDFQPGQRLGVHAGLTLRLGRVDVLAAYSHIFQETIEVGWQDAKFTQVTVETPETSSSAEQPVIVNAGKYTTGFDVISLGVNVHL